MVIIFVSPASKDAGLHGTLQQKRSGEVTGNFHPSVSNIGFPYSMASRATIGRPSLWKGDTKAEDAAKAAYPGLL